MASTNNAPPVILPAKGKARVKSVLSGDTVILLGSAPNGGIPPEVLFTLEGLNAPRMASKSSVDEPGAFEAREYLRKLVIGKFVRFETRKQGGSAGDRVYGWLFMENDEENLAVKVTRLGFASPKSLKYGKKDDDDEYETALMAAYESAVATKLGIHADAPIVRAQKNCNDDFTALALVEHAKKHMGGKLTCIIEHVFDGSRYRCQVVDSGEYQYASFTLLLAGVQSPRIGGTNMEPEEFSGQSRQFVATRLLQRELPISMLGTDKNGVNIVGTVHHPAGNIALELVKNGLARLTDWSIRLMPPAEVPSLRIAETTAKRTHLGIWKHYAPPVLTSASQHRGTVLEVISGDTISLLPEGQIYKSESQLLKISLASIRAPRVGSTLAGRADEPYSVECKERLRNLLVGKTVQVDIHYERDIPMAGETEKRPFGTVSVGKHTDVSEVLVAEGLAITQRHRDDDEKSPRYDELRAAEATSKAAKKNMHSTAEYKRAQVVDLTEPRKAKSYSGSLMRAGNLKAIVEYVFNGGLFKLYIPSENCHIRFSPNYVRCPQPSPAAGRTGKPAEPFGDEAKRHARFSVLQRQVEVTCTGVTNGGIIVGSMNIGYGKQKRDYTMELLGAGFATVDQRKIDYGEAPQSLIDAQETARKARQGLWSMEQPKVAVAEKSPEKLAEASIKAKISEVRSGSHFYYHVVGDESIKVIEDSMKTFTKTNGTAGGPCDIKIGKIIAALFDDGSGKNWYRAKVLERKGPGKISVLFVDYGNVAVVPIATHVRPLDVELETTRIPAVAKEAVLALCVTRALTTDEGMDAARTFSNMCWGKELVIRIFCMSEGKLNVAVHDEEKLVNAELVKLGLARVCKDTRDLQSAMSNAASLMDLAAELRLAEEAARKSRAGMWRFGDVGDDDPDEI